MSDSRSENATTALELVQADGFVDSALVHNRSFVGGLVNWDLGVRDVVLVDFLLEDWLGHVALPISAPL